MKVSGFTFIRNGITLGFPFVQSIKSILPICDEFIVNVGASNDTTRALVETIDDPKIKIIDSSWNDHMKTKGFTYGEQKMIAQYSCTGDWAFYLEGDEVVHEKDLAAIQQAMHQHLNNPLVEALVFDYYHFYGNINTCINSPAWCRRAPRIIKRSVRSFAPDGLFWTVLDQDNKKSRYPRAALANATIYHYGWVRTEQQMIRKLTQIEHYWNKKDQAKGLNYANVDPQSLRLFTGSHPAIITGFFPDAQKIYQTNPQHQLTRKERKNRIGMRLERWFNLDLSNKRFKLVR